MSNPYEQYPTGSAPQQPTDSAAAPTQFMQLGGQPQQQVPQQSQQPNYDAAPQFGQAPQQAPQYGQVLQQSAYGAAPQPQDAVQPAYGAAPQFGQTTQQAPQFGQVPQQAPQFGQAPQQAPQFGQNPPQDSGQGWAQAPGQAPNYSYGGIPVKPAKARRAGIVGIVLGTALGRLGILVVIGLGVWGFNYFHSVHRGANGQITQSGQLDVTQLKVGDCFNVPSGNDAVSTVQAIPCTQAHDAQVYAAPAISESTYPSSATLQAEGKTACGTDSAIASLKAASSSLPSDVSSEIFYPEQSTFDDGTKNFSCAIVGSANELTKSYVSSNG